MQHEASEEKIHEGIIEMVLNCDNPNDSWYNTGEYIDKETLDIHDLKPGDHVQFRLTDDNDVEILAKVIIKKTIQKIKK